MIYSKIGGGAYNAQPPTLIPNPHLQSSHHKVMLT